MERDYLKGCLSTMLLGITFGVGTNIYIVYKFNTALNKYLNEPVIERKDVRGNQKPELFIQREGKRFYAEIDGTSIEDVLK